MDKYKSKIAAILGDVQLILIEGGKNKKLKEFDNNEKKIDKKTQ
ncbi:MAG: hypothetical protein ACFFDN_01330 [Candidatus Hodarchaeota archaeon]